MITPVTSAPRSWVAPPAGRARFALVAVFALLVTFLVPPTQAADAVDTSGEVWINEFHYDNDGTDVNEFIEVVAAVGADLSGWSIVRYNGNGGQPYSSPPSTDEQDLGALGRTGGVDGVSFAVVTYPVNGLQNGAPDGFALVDPDGGVVQFLSYEGTFTAVGGPADGMTSTDVGATQSSSTPVGASLQLTGTGRAYADFTWTSADVNTAGERNDGQVFGEPDGPPPPPACDVPDEDLTLISEVQGPGEASPLVGEQVSIEAVVTLVAPGLRGLFVQEEPQDEDDDPRTSEGVFVFTAGNLLDDLSAGDTVQVTGQVGEFFGKTQISSTADVVRCDGVEAVEIAPVELPLPSAPAERERFEGMLVIASDLVVTGSFQAYRFGELITGYQGELPSATEVAAPGPDAEAAQAQIKAREVILDDRSAARVNGRSVWDQDPERRLGDRIPSVTGIVDFSFGEYKLQYTEFPTFELFEQPLVPQLELGNDIGAFNVLNFFNEFGNSDRLRGARSQEQFDVQSAKIVATILELDARVLGLIELQNDYLDEFDGDPGTEPSVSTLVDLLNAAAGETRYDYVRVPQDQLATDGLNGGGLGPDAIANGIIYQPDEVTLVGTPATFDIDAGLSGDDRKNRWPIAASFDLEGEIFTVAVNHFKSKGSSCGNVIGPDFGVGDDVSSPFTGNCDLTRQYAAQQLVEWVDTDPAGVDDADVFLVGDFNAYRAEAPIRILADAGYVDLIDTYDEGAFTYKFSGRVGSLDYLFASPSAAERVDDAAVWQTNSRASYTDLYFIDPIDLDGPKGASDHDPLVTSLLPPPPPSIEGARQELAALVDDDAIRDPAARQVERALDQAERRLEQGRADQAARELLQAADRLETETRLAAQVPRGPLAQQDPAALHRLAETLRALAGSLD